MPGSYSIRENPDEGIILTGASNQRRKAIILYLRRESKWILFARPAYNYQHTLGAQDILFLHPAEAEETEASAG